MKLSTLPTHARLQKTVTLDYLTKRRVKNNGQANQYYVKDCHTAIIPKEEWEAVQMEIERRRAYCDEIGLRNFGVASVGSPFISRVICGKCKAAYGRKCWSNRKQYFWVCHNKWKKEGDNCLGENVKEETLKKAVVIAWNSVVNKWQEQIAEDPLQKLRNRQMAELISQGTLTQEVPELTRMVLERIVVHSKTRFTVRFLDGTVREVCVTE